MLKKVELDDRYKVTKGEIFLSGIQALVKLPMLQRILDQQKGLNTAGFISGYRGSPLGGYDQSLWKAQKFLDEHHITFKPGINEDLAATAVWGSQQASLNTEQMKYDGVFGIWYGKGPGVDRSCDVFKHANCAGSAKNGGVLLVEGDDHGCKSSTLPHQSEQALMSCYIPNLNPADVKEVLTYGLYGIALSRYSGLWVGLKAITENVDRSENFYFDLDEIKIQEPKDFTMPEDGLNIRWPEYSMDQEKRIFNYKLPAAQAFVRANQLDKTIIKASQKRIGIVTTGKAYLDILQAFDFLGITQDMARDLGISLYKVAMSWPLEPVRIEEFAQDHEMILVIEEKQPLIEDQLKVVLFDMPESKRPQIWGKKDAQGQDVLPISGELNPYLISMVLGQVITSFKLPVASPFSETFEQLKKLSELDETTKTWIERKPFFCSGCPHNTSTRVPEGSRALAGIGCHYMKIWMDPQTQTYTQMGGEGVPWIGQAPFLNEKHVFANLGDGTYYHSGLLAIRASVAAQVNITYKILYNDAVAMTGGQHVDGPLSVPQVAAQVAAEGVNKIVVMSDNIDAYQLSDFSVPVELKPREELMQVQKYLRELEGTTVLIYEQTCAAEKRRRRKRGLMIDPPKRLLINQRVCEGCGDCSVKSNCLSVMPQETEFGRKRKIDQFSCNKDYSCAKGFCPSFVTILGGELKKPDRSALSIDEFSFLPEPEIFELEERDYSVLITGIGGTGVVTIGALLGMAAHLEGKSCIVLDQAGLAQKGGAVTSHLKLAKSPDLLHSARVTTGEVDLLLGCDLVVSGFKENILTLAPFKSRVIVNQDVTMTSDFTKNPDLQVPEQDMIAQLKRRCGDESHVNLFGATHLAAKLLGNTIESNLMLVGYAYQKGLIPLSQEAIFEAVELNGVSVEQNKLGFLIGRCYAHDPSYIDAKIKVLEEGLELPDNRLSQSLDEMIERRFDDLIAYQSKSYAMRFRKAIERVRGYEEKIVADSSDLKLTQAITRYYYKLLAYKDEYEVARLFSDGEFKHQLARNFSGDYQIEFNLAPPLVSKKDLATGEPQKIKYGSWMYHAFGVLSKFKFLRGTPLDIFGYTQERKAERKLIDDYEYLIETWMPKLTLQNRDILVQLFSIPEQIRGYGHIKEQNMVRAQKAQIEILEMLKIKS